eukprot:TRINITY_DN28176_c0_g2_i1.p1 TRINITY_DN28176_c0_g2~~TRINITY_DN28176_c0_g2_i1.p1  ORF type:complete len:410 (-),score=78.04 TRINITY_DN28176_c0_g2_i1:261-1490(-)
MAAAAVAHAVQKRNAAFQEDEENGSSPRKRPHVSVVDLPPEVETGFWKYQRRAAMIYKDSRVQWSVAGLIGGNFLANVVEKSIDPTGTQYTVAWDVLDMFFNLAFLVELILNMYGFWLCRFWRSGWNVFDFVVVSIGMLGVFKVPLPGPLSLLRMMRAFRVFRLFKRIKSLNKILVSLGKAVPGVANAFFILFLMMCIYSILAVEFFGDYAVSGSYPNELGQEVGSTTARRLVYGEEYFSNFGLALYTMFQVLTAESWSEAIARPMIHTTNVPNAFLIAFYFVSFNLLNGVVLINVVIAVLLEKMVDGEVPPDEADDVTDQDSELEGEMPEVPVCPEESMLEDGSQLAVEDVTEPATLRVNANERPRSAPDIGEIECAFTDLKCDMSKVLLQLQAIVEELKRRQSQESG